MGGTTTCNGSSPRHSARSRSACSPRRRLRKRRRHPRRRRSPISRRSRSRHTKVASNFYYLEGQGGNIGVLIGDDGVLMIDDQFAPLTEKIMAAVKALSHEAGPDARQHARARRSHRRQRERRQARDQHTRSRQRARAAAQGRQRRGAVAGRRAAADYLQRQGANCTSTARTSRSASFRRRIPTATRTSASRRPT